MRRFWSAFACTLLFGCALFTGSAPISAARQSAELITNGSFEQPSVGASYQLLPAGQTFPGWKVVGAGDVAVVGGAYTQNGFTFPAKSGAQWADLTGNTNVKTGVIQTVKTSPGAHYTLSFSVGNIVDPTAVFGVSSTTDVLVDGTLVTTAVNAEGQGAKALTWKQFTTTITATNATTTIEFLNEDPSSDNNNSLDAVSLTGAAGSTGGTTTTSSSAPKVSTTQPDTHQAIPDFWAALSARVITKNTLGLGSDLALTAGASNNQILSVTVFERATGCLVSGAYVDLLDPSGNPVVPPGQIRHSVPQSSEGYIDIGGLKNLDAGLYHLWIYAKNSSGEIVMQGYLPVQVKDRHGQAFTTLNGRTFTASGRDWTEGKRATASAYLEADFFGSIVNAFKQIVSGIANAVGLGPKPKAAAVTAAKVLGGTGSPSAKVEIAQTKTNFTPAYLDTTTAPQAADPVPASVKLIGHDGASLIGHDGASLIGSDGAGLIGHDGASLIGHDGASVVSNDGGSLIGSDGAGLIAAGGGNIISAGGGNLVHDARHISSAVSTGAVCLNGYKTVGEGNVLYFGKTPVLANAEGKITVNTYVIAGKNEMPVNGPAK